jgi:Excreted virulence factor EspC, type VII ESX diderm
MSTPRPEPPHPPTQPPIHVPPGQLPPYGTYETEPGAAAPDNRPLSPGSTAPSSSHIAVNTNELRTAADTHDQRGQQWAKVADNPPNNPDELAAAWGVIAHPITEQLRVSNRERTAAATSIQREHEQLAEKLRYAAHAYDQADATGADGVSSSTAGL